jgi:cytosine/adenosine deaminase-related metal-dependent hydrolase
MNHATRLHAAWIVPVIAPPIRNGWIAIQDDRIVAVGEQGDRPAGLDAARPAPFVERDLGDVAILPGLINAHTHLELSWLRHRVPPAPSMPQWVQSLLAVRTAGATGEHVESSVEAAIDEAVSWGTVAMADIANELVSPALLRRRAVDAVVFHEILGFPGRVAPARFAAARARIETAGDASPIRLRLAPHAPYSTSPALIRAIADDAAARGWPPTAIHVAESADELQFLSTGEGAWASMLSTLGMREPSWHPPATSPVAYLEDLGFWRPGTLAVHGVQLTRAELDTLAARDVTIVTCPRSNVWVGAGRPPLEAFVACGVRIAVGTDSLASSPDLSVFGELAQLRRWAPDLPARTLLSWATVNGARALGLEADLGALAPGRRARVLAVRLPPGVQDVEEMLVSGISGADIAWVDSANPWPGPRVGAWPSRPDTAQSPAPRP